MFTDPFPAVAPNYPTSPIQSLILGHQENQTFTQAHLFPLSGASSMLSLLSQNGIIIFMM